MTQVYGCGFVNVTDDTILEAFLPEGIISWEGENNGRDNGCKPKLDYAGRLLFIAADNDPESETYGLPRYLVRATRIPGSPFDLIDVAVAELPELNEGGDQPIPNQLTVDNNGVAYFPGGSVLDDSGNPSIIKAVITGEIEGTLTVEYTITPVGAQGYFHGTYCVTLSKDHLFVATYGSSPGGNGGDSILDYDCATLTYYDSVNLRYAEETPYNMETDCAVGSPNLGWAYVIVGTEPPVGGTIEAFLMPDLSEQGATYETEPEGLEAVLSVGKLDDVIAPGMLFTMERLNRTPGNSNLVYKYTPSGAGAVVFSESFAFNNPMNTPTHLDNRRDDQDAVWAGSSISPEAEAPTTPGGVEENKEGVDDNKQTRIGYVCIGTAAKRETYFPPVP